MNCGEIQRPAHRFENVRVVVRDEVVSHFTVDGDGVVEALVALDELLDRHARTLIHSHLVERSVELGVVIRASGAGSTGRARRFDDDGIAHGRDEVANLRTGAAAHRLRASNAALAKDLFHRGLVAAQEGCLRGRPRDRARFPHMGGRQDMSLDRRFEPIDGELRLKPSEPSPKRRPRPRPTALARSGSTSAGARHRALPFGRSPMPVTVAPTS